MSCDVIATLLLNSLFSKMNSLKVIAIDTLSIDRKIFKQRCSVLLMPSHTTVPETEANAGLLK